jgi:glycosyltransferase involved in cell wall biosynthesis
MSPPSASPAGWLGAVVPARNEEAHVGACLVALDAAARVAGLPLVIVTVLDSCTDGTARTVRDIARALSSRVHLVHTGAGRVGSARRLGVATLLHVLDPRVSWLSTTDADSVVPADWFVRQLAHRAGGADVVVGTVHVQDWQDRGPLRPHWEHQYVTKHQRLADGHRHVHGANLSFRPDAYRASGGFAHVANDEDVRLVDAFQSAGASIVWARDLSVATSVRRTGRAPHGFAAHLNQLARAVAPLAATESGLELTG